MWAGAFVKGSIEMKAEKKLEIVSEGNRTLNRKGKSREGLHEKVKDLRENSRTAR